MVDSIQSRSSIPLPEHLTERSTRDPLPTNSPGQISKVDDKVKTADSDDQRDTFQDYLDQSSITQLEHNQKSSQFDPAGEISKNSVYFDPGKNSPI